MHEAPSEEREILACWRASAAPWTSAVREGRIESRRLVTDAAIVDALLDRSPRTVLDLGCGEGWLARALASHGIDVLGTDAVAELVERAREAGGARFRTMSHAAVAAGALSETFDGAVCNFSLFGARSVSDLFARVPALLNPGGVFVVQTLHPEAAPAERARGDGWRAGSWAGVDDDAFGDPPPWYFRTLETWLALFARSRLAVTEMREPRHPATGRPASVLFVAEPAA